MDDILNLLSADHSPRNIQQVDKYNADNDDNDEQRKKAEKGLAAIYKQVISLIKDVGMLKAKNTEDKTIKFGSLGLAESV
jgi:hypothetical protein